MKVTAMMPWFDEPVALLRQAVRSAAVFCDRIVCADGAYRLVHDAAASSPSRQKKAIADEAAKRGLECEFLPPRIYEGQVHKRDELLQVAMKDSDWLLVLDADWKISGDRAEIRDELAALHANGYQQVCLDFVQPDNPAIGKVKFPNIWHLNELDQWRQLPLVYRVMPKMNYRREHWSIVSEDADGYLIGMWGGVAHPNCGPAKTGYLQAEHVVEHVCLFRQEKQRERNRTYITARDAEVSRVGYET